MSEEFETLDDILNYLDDNEYDENLSRKAIHLLVAEVIFLNNKIQYLIDLVTIKYKKFNPKSGENPFFTNRPTYSPTPEQITEARKRMEDLLDKK